MSTVNVLGARVLLKALPDEEYSKGGIVIPISVHKNPNLPRRGKVLSVGCHKVGDNIVPLDVQVGEVVLFDRYKYIEFIIDDDEVFIVHENNIIGVLEQ